MRPIVVASLPWLLIAAESFAQVSAAEVGAATSVATAADAEAAANNALAERVEAALPPHVGAAVMVRLGGEVVFQRGFGLRRLATAEPVTPQTAFRLASASKVFTAAAALKLVDDGKLALDATLDTFFEDLPEAIHPVTVEQLLLFTAGLASYEQSMPSADAPKGGYRDADVVAWLRTEPTPLFAPGETCRYDGTNYVLLGLIIEKASGRPFEQYLAETFFEPLGMDGAALLVEGECEPAERAFGHDRDRFRPSVTIPDAVREAAMADPAMTRLREKDPGAAERIWRQAELKAAGWIESDQSNFSRLRGDGCVYASLNDLNKWFDAMAAGEVLSESSLEKIVTGQTTPDESLGFAHDWGFKYTCGWLADAYDGSARLSHRGSTQGFRQTLQWMPERDAAVVVLTNSTGPWDLREVGEAVLPMVVGVRAPSE